jgi:hypothetical protein
MTTIQQSKTCDVCAFHEAGYILFAYLCGYTCLYTELINEDNEEGYSSITLIEYGKDAHRASTLSEGNIDIDYFRTLSLGEKLETIETGRRLSRIFLGGSVAMAVHKNEGNPHIPLPIQIDYIDLVRTEQIHYVLQELCVDKEEDFIENILKDTLYTLSNINLWNTIDDLSQRLIQHKQLSKNDIEECLEERGVL